MVKIKKKYWPPPPWTSSYLPGVWRGKIVKIDLWSVMHCLPPFNPWFFFFSSPTCDTAACTSNATFIRRNSLVGEMAVTAPSNKMSHTALHYSLRLDVSKPHYRLIRLSPQLPLLLPFIVSTNQVWSEVTIATLYFFHQLPLTRRAPYQWFHENSMHKVLQKFFDLFWTHLSCRLDGTK